MASPHPTHVTSPNKLLARTTHTVECNFWGVWEAEMPGIAERKEQPDTRGTDEASSAECQQGPTLWTGQGFGLRSTHGVTFFSTPLLSAHSFPGPRAYRCKGTQPCSGGAHTHSRSNWEPKPKVLVYHFSTKACFQLCKELVSCNYHFLVLSEEMYLKPKHWARSAMANTGTHC